jgi:iron complex transport system substrate-binding protein
LELLLATRPDLVLLSEASSAAEQLERNGIAVWAGSARTFDDVFRVIDVIGRIVDRRARADELAEHIRKEVAAVETSLAAVEPVRVYYELDATPYSVGPGSFIGVLLAKARGANIVPATLGDFPKISPELVIAGDPQVIIGAPLAEVAARPGWNGIRAVRDGHVYDPPRSESQLVARPGPRIAEGLRLLARLLHPEIAR